MAPATTRCAVCVVIAVINACAAADTAGRHTSFAIAASGSVEPFPQRQPGQGSMVRQLEATTIVAAEGTNAAATPHTTAAKNISTAAAQDPSKTEDIPIPDEEIKGSLAVKRPVPHLQQWDFFLGTACNFLGDHSRIAGGDTKGTTEEQCQAACTQSSQESSPLYLGSNCLSFEWRGHSAGASNSRCQLFTAAATNIAPSTPSICGRKQVNGKKLQIKKYKLCRWTPSCSDRSITAGPACLWKQWENMKPADCKRNCKRQALCKGMEWIERHYDTKIGDCKFFAASPPKREIHVCYVKTN